MPIPHPRQPIDRADEVAQSLPAAVAATTGAIQETTDAAAETTAEVTGAATTALGSG